MRLVSATADRMGSTLMDGATLGVCAQDRHSVRQLIPIPPLASRAKAHAEGSMR